MAIIYSVSTNIFKLYLLVPMNIFKLYSSVLKPTNINLYSLVLTRTNEYMRAQAWWYGPVYIRRLTDEYRRDLETDVCPFPPCAREVFHSAHLCSSRRHRRSLLGPLPPSLSAHAATTSLARPPLPQAAPPHVAPDPPPAVEVFFWFFSYSI
jgi:hypothetical protein